MSITDTQLTPSARAYRGITFYNGYLYACVGQSGIYRIDTATGDETVLAYNSGWVSGIVAYNSMLYVCVSDGRIIKVDPTDGTSTDVTSTSAPWSGITAYNGYLYAAQYGGSNHIWKIDPNNGSMTQVTSTARSWEQMTVHNGFLYVTTSPGYVYRINPTTGEQYQLTRTSRALRGIFSVGAYLYTCTFDTVGKMFRVGVSDGCEVDLEVPNRGWFGLCVNNDVLYGTTVASYVFKLNVPSTAFGTERLYACQYGGGVFVSEDGDVWNDVGAEVQNHVGLAADPITKRLWSTTFNYGSLRYSYDAKSWMNSSAPNGGSGMYNQVSAYNNIIAVARTDMNQLAYSTNGTTWTTMGPSGHWFGICRDSLGKFFGNYAVGSTYYLAYGDADGFTSTTWTNGVPLSVKFYDGTYFVCTYDQGVWTSNDRTTWTQLIATTKIVVDLERFHGKLYLSCISDNIQVWDGQSLVATSSPSAGWRGITQVSLLPNLVIPRGGSWTGISGLKQNTGAWSDVATLLVPRAGAWTRA